ncbi:MAG TPA: preprotein translocase subunit SecG [Candidatus Paceibacterota bacterium]|nr:preprotein translocase subunit SecG [Candidatus Paceibacterota bacterium]
MKNIIIVAQIILGIFIVILIAIQQKEGGLSNIFGGGASNFTTRRGIEKYIHILTIVFITIFIILSILVFRF